MKTIVVEEKLEGLESLLGKQATFFCMNYFYNGEVADVSKTCVKLRCPKLIYETGKWSAANWKDAQSMEVEYIYVQISAIEAFAETK